MGDIKEEKRQAKLQDKAFVDYRRAEILHDIKPKNKAFNLKKFDDSFPKPVLRKGTQIEFGELMHKYLVMRPDPRFATWPGKIKQKHKQGGRPDPDRAPDEKKPGLMKKLTTATGVTKKEVKAPEPKKPVKNYNKAVKHVLMQQAVFEDEEIDQKRINDARQFLPREEIDVKNKYSLNAIVENKPFWLVGDPVVPEDEEESYVDAEMLTNYLAAPTHPYNPKEREKFYPWGPTPQLWNLLAHYQDKKLVIGNTLRSIVISSADKMGLPKERVDKGHKPILKFNTTVKQIEYVMESVPLEKTAICSGKLQDIVKTSEKKE